MHIPLSKRHKIVNFVITKYDTTVVRPLFLTFFCLWGFVLSLAGQTVPEVEGAHLAWEDFVAILTSEEDDDEHTTDEEMLEELQEWHAHPTDINSIGKEDLQRLPFLSEEQVESVLTYVEKHGPLLSLGELMMVPNLGQRERDMLRLFVTVKPRTATRQGRTPTVGELLKHGEHEAVWRSEVPLYRKAGYAEVPSEVLALSPNKVYRGDALHHAFRYAFSSMNHLQAGLTAEQDAGERGVDHVSGYILLKDVGVVRRMVVGNYRACFGHGLAMNTAMGFGKTSMVQTMDRLGAGFTKHSSTLESGYLTGIAATLQWRAWQVSAFGSYRKGDGIYTNDSTGLSSLKTDGLHRTQLEHSRRGNLGMTTVGGNLHWQHQTLQLAATAVATHLSVPLTPKHDTPSSHYRRYNAHGQDFLVGSLAYTFRFSHLLVSGETAVSHCDRQNGTATLHTLRWQMDELNTLTLVGRYYGAKFVSLHGKSFGENASVQNETGVFLQWQSRSIRHLVLETYIDAMHFPWLKSQVSSSSNGVEAQGQVTYSPRRRWSMLVRYRFKSKQRDIPTALADQTSVTMAYKTIHTAKLQLSHQLSRQLSLRTTANGLVCHFGPSPTTYGFAFSEHLRWQSRYSQRRFDIGITYFHTDNYDSRIYLYEAALPYTSGSTACFDHGLRTTLMASIPLTRESLTLNAKLGMTKYFNRSAIGTGLERINANHREDLQLQLRWQF